MFALSSVISQLWKYDDVYQFIWSLKLIKGVFYGLYLASASGLKPVQPSYGMN